MIEAAEVLFQLTTSEDHTVTFGGVPWHYINRTPKMKSYHYEARSLCYDRLVINWQFYQLESNNLYLCINYS